MEVISWCTEVDLPVLVLLNKIDKLNQKERAACRKIVKNALIAHHELVTILEFSAVKGTGTPEALAAIQGWRDAEPTS